MTTRDDVLEEAAQVADREANAIRVAIMTRGSSMDMLLRLRSKVAASTAERLARNLRAMKSRPVQVTATRKHPSTCECGECWQAMEGYSR